VVASHPIPPGEQVADTSGHHDQLAVSNDRQWALMSSLGIQFDGRAFRFGGYRYDRLEDAASRARHNDGELDGARVQNAGVR